MSFKTITYKGKEVRAFDFLMKKENALDIISGKKKIEFRDFSPHYCNLFENKEKDNEGNKITRNDIHFIHFTNYNKSWFLNVKIEKVDYCAINKNWHDYFVKNYDTHDFEGLWQKNEGKDWKNCPAIFFMPILEVLEHNIQIK